MWSKTVYISELSIYKHGVCFCFFLILIINYINSFVLEWDLFQVLLRKPASVAVIVSSFMAILDRPNPEKKSVRVSHTKILDIYWHSLLTCYDEINQFNLLSENIAA